jgi:hypothetical protein
MSWSVRAYLAVGLLLLTVGYVLFQVPFGVSDNFTIILMFFRSPSVAKMFASNLNLQGFMRPMMWAASKVVFDLSAGHIFETYRALHVVMVGTILFGTIRLARVRSPLTFGLALLSVAAAIGFGPFHEAVRETELNTKLLITTLCFCAVLLADSRPRLWKDVAAILLTVWAVLTIELGLLVWVCLVAAFLVGMRGVSKRGIAAVTACVAVYFYLRFVRYDVGVPGLIERSSGFGLSVREPPELIAMFGANPLPFYAYNVIASAMGILFGEPRSGVFALVREVLTSKLTSGTVLNVVTSTVTSGLLVWFAARRWRAWRTWTFTHEDGLFLLAMSVLAANAAISFPYTKDVTMSTAAAFYPLAMFAALHALTSDLPGRTLPAWRAVATYALLLTVSLGWTVRGATFYLDMRRESQVVRQDWATVHEFLDSQGMGVANPRERAFVDGFRAEMLALPSPRAAADHWWLRLELDPH